MSQSEFRAALLDPSRPAPEGLTGPAGQPAGRRFDVYRNNVTVSLTEALRQAFPVIRKLVGEEFFTAMAREHLRAHPPASPLMMFYGAAMPAFLETFPPVAHLGYLPDIARLELALRQSYHAADAAPVAAEALQTLTPDAFVAARLRLAPSVRLLRSCWPIHAIWTANARNGTAPKQATAEDVLIVRPDFDPEPLLLPAGAAPFVAALAEGRTVGEALDAAGAFDLTATLGLLLGGSAIVGIITGE
ncbi:HvfC/BufC N-terminal domain-containing protein [Defluviimonas salinarum]|uniref:DNA-binding domain-containing protein n=1 Tax=Defluviimonas salinarum TaxID=2992147 RepID=A0ABT3J2L9_9RHOB|nr:DNA-binding domain-containing protein [Defluviimonas salinarum]MCW3781936.1 DNA-binding domain-containing protein [Defluviimonas salinarum]